MLDTPVYDKDAKAGKNIFFEKLGLPFLYILYRPYILIWRISFAGIGACTQQ